MPRKPPSGSTSPEPPDKPPQPLESEAAPPSAPKEEHADVKKAPPIVELFSLEPAKATDQQLADIVRRQVQLHLEGTGISAKYNLLFVFDKDSITRSDANRIYTAVSKADKGKPILLLLSSRGGDIAAAYFIAKLCREYTREAFEVVVPREAKSAATLICCGADRIHMGSLSELGPIDPQFGGVPALALKYSVEHLAQLAKDYPAASTMFSDYLSKSLRVEALGHYERVAESATHYAMRLLNARVRVPPDPEGNTRLARRLVYAYKDHGFVIDSREATDIFGSEVVASNTPEYQTANDLFGSLDLAAWVCGSKFSRKFSYTGDVQSGCWVFAKSE